MPADAASTTEAPALRPLPPLDTLTEEQKRGTSCVWDGIPLTPAIAVDLGPRIIDGVRRFPRACHRCANLGHGEHMTAAEPGRIATAFRYCNWCKGHTSDDVRLISIADQGSGPGQASTHACRTHRLQHQLTPLAETS